MLSARTRIQGISLWVAALIVIGTGFYLSKIEYLGHEWVSRAGCLVVVLGIWSGISRVVEGRLYSNSLDVRRRLSISALRRRFRNEQEERDKRVSQINKTYENKIAEIKDGLELSFGILEASLLITGTITWGFGDLSTHLFSG